MPDPGEDLLPNLFIPGAPKAGTTSLYQWLTPHPEVFMSPFKEPHHFCDDLTMRRRPYKDLADYLSLFGAAGDQRYRGEATTWYLYSEMAPEAIRKLCGTDVRILPMLRNPVEMVHSLHSQMVYQGVEPIKDFDQALEAEQSRREDPSSDVFEGLYYTRVARYTEQLDRYERVFGSDKLHVILFDDLVSDNEATYTEVCRFLGIDETVRPSFERANPNTKVRSHWFRDITSDLPGPVQAVTERLPMGLRLKLRELTNRVNTKQARREPMSEEARAYLVESYRPEVEALAKRLDRDLDHWIVQDG